MSGRGSQEFGDGLRKHLGWFDGSEADLKASELDRVLGKHELLRVQSDAEGEPVGHVCECLSDVLGPHKGIIHAFGLDLDKSVKSGTVSITRRFVSRGGCQVAVSSPRCDKGCKMSIIWVE